MIIVKFQSFFVLRGYLDCDLAIAAAVLIVLVSYSRCTKTMQTVHAKVICSFMCCIQRLKQPWQVFDYRLTSLFSLSIKISKLPCLLLFPLSSDFWAVYILFLLLNSTFTTTLGLFFSNLPFFALSMKTLAHFSCTYLQNAVALICSHGCSQSLRDAMLQ